MLTPFWSVFRMEYASVLRDPCPTHGCHTSLTYIGKLVKKKSKTGVEQECFVTGPFWEGPGGP